MRPIALAGSIAQPSPPADDLPLLDALLARGATVGWCVWETDAPEAGAAVVPRASWTYHRAEADYRAWLSTAEARGCSFVNPLGVIRWNLDKGYLAELGRAGVDVIPTLRFPAGGAPGLAEVFRLVSRASANTGRSRGTGEGGGIVLKPAVSASGDDTWRARDPDDPADEERWRLAAVARPHLAQPFLPEVLVEGEWSAVVVRGAVTHVVRKLPAAGEFRVQGERGGSKELVADGDVPAPVLRGALSAWRAVPGAPAYARMDGIRVGDRFLLMEAELIDPELYLTMSGEGAANALAGAILDAADGTARAARASAS